MADQTVGDRIKLIRLERGLSQDQLAGTSGLSQQAINALENGTNKSSPRLPRIAAALGVRPEWLFDGAGNPFLDNGPQSTQQSDLYRLMSPVNDIRTNDTIPIYGVAECGSDGLLEWNGEIISTVARPVALTGVANAYALYIIGSSMEPRYFSGEIVFVHPGKPVTPGSYAVVQLAADEGENRRALVKQFVRRTSTHHLLHQFNPDKQLKFDNGMVRAIHRIVQSGEA